DRDAGDRGDGRRGLPGLDHPGDEGVPPRVPEHVRDAELLHRVRVDLAHALLAHRAAAVLEGEHPRAAAVHLTPAGDLADRLRRHVDLGAALLGGLLGAGLDPVEYPVLEVEIAVALRIVLVGQPDIDAGAGPEGGSQIALAVGDQTAVAFG